jgi:hypothetical protein
MLQGLVFLLLLFMMVLGPVQMILSLILQSDFLLPKRRKYFAVYWLGIVGYFVGIYLHHLPIDALHTMASYRIYFFLGAASLAIYNLLVCLLGHRLP